MSVRKEMCNAAAGQSIQRGSEETENSVGARLPRTEPDGECKRDIDNENVHAILIVVVVVVLDTT